MQHTKIHKNMKSGHHKQAFASICAGAHGKGKSSMHTERFSLRLRLILTTHPRSRKSTESIQQSAAFRSSGERKGKSSLRGNTSTSLLSFLAQACCAYRVLSSISKKTIFINFQHWILIKREDWVSKKKKCKKVLASELKRFIVVLSSFLNVAPQISLIQNLPLGSFDNGIKGSVFFRAFDDCCKVFSWFSHWKKKEIKRKIIQFLCSGILN